LLIGAKCGAHTFPIMDVMHSDAQIEHEASTTTIDEEKLRYCKARGLDEAQAITMIVNGFCKPIFQILPLEFAVEARQLMEISLEGCVG
jgi:Fe-S cluster assembly protein SufB